MADWQVNDSGQLWKTTGTTAAVAGVTITGGPGPSTGFGAYVQVATAAPRTYAGFLLHVFKNTQAGAFAIDLAWTGNAVDDTVDPDRFVRSILLQSPRIDQMGYSLYIPMEVAQGKELWAKVHSSVFSAAIDVSVVMVADGWDGMGGFQVCELFGKSIGTFAGIIGTPMTALAGAAENSLVNVSTSTAGGATTAVRPLKAVTLLLGQQARSVLPTARFLWDVRFDVGAEGDVPRIFQASTTANDQVYPQVVGPIPLQVVAGRGFAARVQTTDNANQLMDIAILGFG